jgi:hypothetical protein
MANVCSHGIPEDQACITCIQNTPDSPQYYKKHEKGNKSVLSHPWNTTWITTEGRAVSRGYCVIPDSTRDWFVLEIDSLSGVSPQALKDHIQKLFKIKEIEHTNRIVIVKDSGI